MSTHVARFTSGELAAGAAWSSFVDSNDAVLAQGFRPARVDAVAELTENLEIIDETLCIGPEEPRLQPPRAALGGIRELVE